MGAHLRRHAFFPLHPSCSRNAHPIVSVYSGVPAYPKPNGYQASPAESTRISFQKATPRQSNVRPVQVCPTGGQDSRVIGLQGEALPGETGSDPLVSLP